MSASTSDHHAYSDGSAPDPLLLQSLAGLNATDEMRGAQTARRRVAGKILSGRGLKEKTRRNRAIAIFASLGILVLLSPAIWHAVEYCIAEEHFVGLGTQITLLILLFGTALLSALIAGWVRHSKRNG